MGSTLSVPSLQRTFPLLAGAVVATLAVSPVLAVAWDPVALSSGNPPQNAAPAPQGTLQGAPLPDPTPAAGEISVAVLPFRVLKADPAATDIGETLQQSVIAALSTAPSVKLYHLSPPATAAGNGRFDSNELAITTAKAAGLGAVVVGTYQSTDTDARITASVYLASGKLLGVATSHGATRQIFALQDDVGRQVRDLLAPGTKNARPPGLGPAAGAPPAPAAQAGQPGQAGQAGQGRQPAPDFANTTPVPFEGSTLQRVLSGQTTLPAEPTAGTTDAGVAPTSPYGYGYYGSYGYGRNGLGRPRPGSTSGDDAQSDGASTTLQPTTTDYPAFQRYSYTGSPYSAGGSAPGAGNNGPNPPNSRPPTATPPTATPPTDTPPTTTPPAARAPVAPPAHIAPPVATPPTPVTPLPSPAPGLPGGGFFPSPHPVSPKNAPVDH